MTARTVIPEDFRVHGELTCKTLQLPPNSVGDQEVSPSTQLSALKRLHRHTIDFRKSSLVDVAALVHHFRAPGNLIAIEATCGVAPTGDREVSIDLEVGNVEDEFVSVLVHPIVFDADHKNCEVCRAPISEFECAAGDVVRVVLDVTTGTTGTFADDLVVTITWEENP